MSSDNKDPVRVAAGLKATLHRDNVSDEAKQNAEERLKEMGATSSDEPAHGTKLFSLHAQYRWKHKAATSTNEATSDEAQAHAREILEAAGYTVTDENVDRDEHEVRVLAGYKAALNNPRVSEKAKKHAREYLQEHGAVE
ncbi:Conidiation protein 6-domain-containing protein [Mycena latifolia]|nr:Conidiation protein 6-domain-containing protein [Mycena latifolia]